MSRNQQLFPGATIGVLGGGQLGRMIILEGRKLGYRFISLDPAADCPAAQVADEHLCAPYDDLQAAAELAKRSDVVVYEFENIDPALVEYIESRGSVPQSSRLLRLTGHRLREKQAVTAAGVPVAAYWSVSTTNQLAKALKEIGLPAVLKRASGGYDGKGQWMLHDQTAVDQIPNSLFAEQPELVLEQFIPFCKELSVVVARSQNGEIQSFPPTVNLHRNHILHLSLAPAPLSSAVAARAKALAEQTAERLRVVGLLAVEMFLLPSGKLLVNELAPRPHNSGHYSYDACSTSQFEQFLRAILGLPLHEPRLLQPAVMINLLGEDQPAFERQLYRLPTNVKVHWYGKTEAKTGRKMGHLTILGDSPEQVIEQVDRLLIWSELTVEERETLERGIES